MNRDCAHSTNHHHHQCSFFPVKDCRRNQDGQLPLAVWGTAEEVSKQKQCHASSIPFSPPILALHQRPFFTFSSFAPTMRLAAQKRYEGTRGVHTAGSSGFNHSSPVRLRGLRTGQQLPPAPTYILRTVPAFYNLDVKHALYVPLST